MFGRKQVLKQQDGMPDYHLGPQFSQGAEGFVYEMEFGLPVMHFRGPGRLTGSMSVLQPPQVEYPLQVPLSGLGGTIAGGIVSTPLVRQEDIL